MRKIAAYSLLFIALLMIISSGAYYISSLSWLPWSLSLLASAALTGLAIKKRWLGKTDNETGVKNWQYFLPFILTFTAFFATLINHSTTQAIISPWQALPWIIWPLFILLATALIWAGKKSGSQGLAADLSLILFYLSFLSIAVLVYGVGYGFDSFIHEASMRYIEANGYILPKTPYYIGQYGLTITLDRLLPFSLGAINRFLLPVFASLFLVPAFRSLLSTWKVKESNSFLATIAILPAFVLLFFVTTPQNLAFLFLILSITYALSGNIRLGLLLSLATACIHPISGLPTIFAVTLITIYRHDHYKKLKKWLVPAGIIGLPLILAAAFLISGASFRWSGWQGISSLAVFLWPFPYQESALLNTVYFFLHNVWLIGLVGLSWGVWQTKRSQVWWQRPILISALAALLSGMLVALFLSFDSLIFYEQNDYARRLLLSAWLLALPILLYGLTDVAARIAAIKPKAFIPALACLLAIALYGSYPRFDNYRNSRGYSLSQSDLEAVHMVEDMAGGKSYIALANQQSGVGALKEFGFGRYLSDQEGLPLYFYSIPTGGKLYQHYLSMVYDGPKTETMEKAMDEAGVDTAFLLVSRYWWASDKIIAEARMIADGYQMTKDDEIAVFMFER